jgi:hypothetical protein
LDLVRRNTDTHTIHSTSGKHAMNTMTNTAQFTDRTQSTPVEGDAFFGKLARKMLGLLCMISAVNSVDQALLAERIVLE